jgi:hypothetical protein
MNERQQFWMAWVIKEAKTLLLTMAWMSDKRGIKIIVVKVYY